MDNEVARFCLIKGYSHASMVCKMVNAIAIHFEKNLILSWFLRVPLSENISDFPSRSVEHPFLDTSLFAETLSDLVFVCAQKLVWVNAPG